MFQCLEVAFGTVNEVISSQVHQLNCCKDTSLLYTPDMLDKIQYVHPSSPINKIQWDHSSVAVKKIQNDHKTAALKENQGPHNYTTIK